MEIEAVKKTQIERILGMGNLGKIRPFFSMLEELFFKSSKDNLNS